MHKLLKKIDKDLDISPHPELGRMVNWGGGASIPIHRWFRYREGYSPDLIEYLQLGKRILDPFCGCGSTMFGAARTGRESLGIDVNPLAVFAAQTKLSPLTSKQISELVEFRHSFQRLFSRRKRLWPKPTLKIADKVFEPDIIQAILKLRQQIEDFSEDTMVRNVLFLAWLAILENVGSYFKEGNGIKYRNKKRLKTGYVKRQEGEWQLQRFGPDQKQFVLDAYDSQLKAVIEDSSNWTNGSWSSQKVVEGSALDMDVLVEDCDFDGVIFSPPYANRFDYFESMKVELWFGSFVSSYEDNMVLRKRSLRSNLAADLSAYARNFELLEILISKMDKESSSWRMRVPNALRGYFDDMYRVLIHCKRVLAQKGQCAIVVGNSAFAGVLIPTDSLLAILALQAGFSSAKICVARHLTVAPQQRSLLSGLESFMRESVVILK